jgi:hypothetical protein
MATKTAVLSQMTSNESESVHMSSMRKMVIKNRREENTRIGTETYRSITSKISFITMIAVVAATIYNPEPIKMVWGKIAPYILL